MAALCARIAMLFCLPSLRLCSQCDAGCQVCLDGASYAVRAICSYDTKDNSGTKQVELRGSYLADSTGTHTFYCSSATYGTDGYMYTSLSSLEWESSLTSPTDGEWSDDRQCVKDYRYAICLALDSGYKYVKCSIAVQTPARARFDLTGDNYVQTCQESGCRERDYERSPYDCQPSPSPPKSASPCRSPPPSMSPGPSISTSHSPTPSSTLSPMPTHTPSPSPKVTPGPRSPTPSESPRPTQTWPPLEEPVVEEWRPTRYVLIILTVVAAIVLIMLVTRDVQQVLSRPRSERTEALLREYRDS
jgi:hypothetical protein